MFKLEFDTFSEFYDSLRAELYPAAYRVTKNHGFAEDAVAETLVHILEHMETLQAHPNPGGYIYQTLINKARNIMSRSRYATEVSLSEELPSGYETTIQENFRDSLPNTLSEREKNMLVLHYEYRYTSHEIALMLGIRDGACRMRISQILKKMRKAVCEDPYTPYNPRNWMHGYS